MRIASHHQAGTAEHKLSALLTGNVQYTPACAWPDDCTVQWGHGIIPSTPFFEAFPTGTFIRGEGPTIADAEARAFAQFESEFSCRHVWGRQRPGHSTYLNGAGWCRKCGAFRGKMFAEVVELGHWRRPVTIWEADFLRSLETDAEMNAQMDRKYPGDAAGRRKIARILRLRTNLFGATS
ncbi:hypothetical protein [Sphingomonas sp. Leaf226]|uniref:hypothetical protein n=1 Tax=Sphingomonas sp. Leaf226 TaxID=1735691 RepID=UPI0006F34455|nr:hypothetical protein [Sphingomonas sp. Leaf226]KQM97149.1 hypothetical protein ASE77_18685 [Sphingomonas sp. Leaf226]